MPSVTPDGAPDRSSRSVWTLSLVVLVVFGFAFGGSARAAVDLLDSPTAGPLGISAVAAALPAPLLAAPARTPIPAPADQAPADPIVADPIVADPIVVAPIVVKSTATRAGVPLPPDSGSGRRIVYRQNGMHLWVVDADGTVVRDYAVTGRRGWPLVGTYHVFSKSLTTASPKYGVTFRWMVRFAHGHALSIGFHDIPRRTGSGIPIQAESNLGAPVGHGGCVRQRSVDAQWLYGWAQVGTTVVVLR